MSDCPLMSAEYLNLRFVDLPNLLLKLQNLQKNKVIFPVPKGASSINFTTSSVKNPKMFTKMTCLVFMKMLWDSTGVLTSGVPWNSVPVQHGATRPTDPEAM